MNGWVSAAVAQGGPVELEQPVGVQPFGVVVCQQPDVDEGPQHARRVAGEGGVHQGGHDRDALGP